MTSEEWRGFLANIEEEDIEKRKRDFREQAAKKVRHIKSSIENFQSQIVQKQREITKIEHSRDKAAAKLDELASGDENVLDSIKLPEGG